MMVAEIAWGPVLAALIAVGGVFASLWSHRKLARDQREFELRRTELFALVSNASIGIQVLNEAGLLEKSVAELQRIKEQMAASHTRAMCFAESETVRASYNLELSFMKGWHPVARTLSYHSLLDKLLRQGTVEVGKELDESKKANLERALDTLEQLRRRAHIRLMEESAVAGRNYSRAWTELELAVRAEINRVNVGDRWTPMTFNEYRTLVETTLSEIEALNQQSLNWNKALVALMDDGDDIMKLIQFFEKEQSGPAG